MVRPRTVPLLVLLLAACRSGATAPTVSSSSSPPVSAPSALSDTPRASAPHADKQADAAKGPAAGEVTLRFINRSKTPRYIGFARDWTERFSIERREGDRWVQVAHQRPMCSELCPADGSAPACRMCSPPIPVPGARTVKSFDHTWSGKEYVERKVGGAKCSCVQETPAQVGRYRATLCTTDELQCDPAPCKPDEYGNIRRNIQRIGEPTCKSVEFDLTPEAKTVAVEL